MTVTNFPNALPNFSIGFQGSRKLDPRITFTRASGGGAVGTGSGNVNGEVYTFQENVPRLTSQGLLVEDDRTNHIDRSVDLTNTTTWNNNYFNATINSGTSPDGTNTAVSLVPDTSDTTKSFMCKNITTTFSGTLTVSVFLKANGYDKVQLYIDGASAGGAFNGGANFNLSTGVVTQLVGVGSITPYPNGWYRCSVTHTNTAQQFNVRPGISALNDSGSTKWAGDGTSGYLVWGFQLEEGSPTSYIPTSGAAVTRAADLAEVTGANFASWYSPNESTWVVSGIQNGVDANGFQNAAENPFVDRFTNILPERVSATQWRCMQAQYARIPAYTTGSTPQGEPEKIAVAFDSRGGGMNMAVRGVVSSQGPLNNNYPGTNTLQLGRSLGASNWWNGTITQLTYYPTRVSNDALQALTTQQT